MDTYGFNFKDIVENALDIIIVTKADMINEPGPEIVYVNEAFVKLSGYSREEAIGKSPRILQSHETDAETKTTIRKALQQQEPVRVTIKNYSKSGQSYWLDLSIMPLKNDDGVVTHFMAIQRDVTQHKILEQKLEILSNTDELTGLYNLRSFTTISNNEYSRFKRKGHTYSVLMIDIDFFKSINDTYGHAIGDLAIQHLATLCKENIRSHDVMARVGGEEFCIMLPDTTKDSAYMIAEKLRNQLNNDPLIVADKAIVSTISIGVAESDIDDKLHKDIINRADEALYEAKNNGRNCVY